MKIKPEKNVNYFSLWLPVLLYMGFIFFLSAQSEPPKPEFELPFMDKLAHLVLYTGLGCLLYRAIFFTFGDAPYLGWYVVFMVVLYGISDEFHQSFVPLRTPDAFDVLFDGLGGIIAGHFTPLKRLMTRGKT